MATISKPVKQISGVVKYTDTAGVVLFTLPPGSVPLRWTVNVTTAFNNAGTDLLDIGKSGSTEFYAKDVDVSATGNTVVTSLNSDELTAMTAILATYTGSSTAATTGLATVILEYTDAFQYVHTCVT